MRNEFLIIIYTLLFSRGRGHGRFPIYCQAFIINQAELLQGT